MSIASYNCPCCCGPLKFSGESGKLECTACGNNYEPEALEMMTPEESGDEITFANDAKRFDTGGGRHAGQPVERVFLCGFPAGQRAGDESVEKGKSPLRRQPARG